MNISEVNSNKIINVAVKAVNKVFRGGGILERKDLISEAYILLLDIVKKYDSSKIKNNKNSEMYLITILKFRLIDYIRKINNINRGNGRWSYNKNKPREINFSSLIQEKDDGDDDDDSNSGSLKPLYSLEKNDYDFVDIICNNDLADRIVNYLQDFSGAKKLYKITETERFVFMLWASNGYTMKEIAENVNFSAGRVSQIITKVKKILKKEFEEDYKEK